MTTQKQAPLALGIVAALFIISGIFAALKVLVLLTRGSINLNFGVLGIFIGLGLLRFRRGWRTCALVFTWIALVFVPVFALLVLGGAHPIHVKLLGQRIGSTSPGTALFIAVAAFVVVLWQYRVLTRRDVVQLFNEQAELYKECSESGVKRLRGMINDFVVLDRHASLDFKFQISDGRCSDPCAFAPALNSGFVYRQVARSRFLPTGERLPALFEKSGS